MSGKVQHYANNTIAKVRVVQYRKLAFFYGFLIAGT
jgi:hypothetical protein